MAVKTITVTENAYESIKRMKRESESFSDLFVRLSSEKKSTGRSIVGLLKGADTEKLLKASEDVRKRFDKDMEERKRVLARQFGRNRNDDRRKKA
ncbi:MAG: antitoxin VapB family protein [Candidatus Aenigmarchaeota archaeon]|nr:antitoxin VapB family protein [Candidatus Aenigmarchaeota archaeon]